MPNDVLMRLLLFLLCATAAVYLSHVARADVAAPPGDGVDVRAYVIDRNWVQVVADIPKGRAIPSDSLSFTAVTPGYGLGSPKLPVAKNGRYRGEITVNLPLKYTDTQPDRALVIDLLAGYTVCDDGGACGGGETKTLQITVPGAAPAPAPAVESAAEQGGGMSGLLTRIGRRLGIGGGGGERRFLKPDQAFILSTEVPDANTITARWDIADGYYLYRKKFSFSLATADGVQLGDPQFPPGKTKVDDTFGPSEVYYKNIVARIPVIRSNTHGTHVTLVTKYQGCADAGFCYPPMTKTVDIDLPPQDGGGVTGASGTTTPPLSETDRLAHRLAGGDYPLTLASFLGLGLLLAFTPCVFPMVPILSGIIVGQGGTITTRRAFTLSLVYVLPMAVTYTAAGVVAGMVGENLQAVFQAPWIIITFSAVFVALALSMFGFYELQLPNRWQTRLATLSNRQRGGTLLGVAAMGLFSALIVGPCVAAPLAGALLYIGQTHDAVVGGGALFAMSLGMGIPLLIFGTAAGKFLPRAGAWMESIKTVFGVLLLGTAVWFLARILPAPVTMGLWAALLLLCAFLLGALRKSTGARGGWARLRKGAAWLTMVYGMTVLVGAASGGQDVFQPLKGSRLLGGGTVVAAASLHFVPVKGLDGLHRALAAADAQGKPVLLDFYADWCIDCKKMERNTFSDPRVQTVLSRYVVLQSDVTAYDSQDQALLNAYGLPGPPAILFFHDGGQELRGQRVIGYQDASDFIEQLHAAL
jgi:thiol:disulfide interchange protein DsbD